MDDESRGMRRGKPQQQYYSPGSGPLKKSPMGPDDIEGGKPEFPSGGNDPPRRGHGRSRHNRHSNKDSNRFHEDVSDRLSNISISNHDPTKPAYYNRKPEQPNHAPKRDGFRSPSPRRGDAGPAPRGPGNARFEEPVRSNSGYGDNNHESRSKRYSGNRRHPQEGEGRENDNHRRLGDGRLNSEPRNMSPPRKVMMENQPPRGRDTRSMDSSRHMHHSNGSKPPTGRRGSGLNMGFNLDSMPPRFRKKFLAESGQLDPESNAQAGGGNNYQPGFYNQPQQHHPPQQHGPPMWSQTLPSRGRGRLRDEDFDREKLKHTMNAYLQTFDSGTDSRSSTPHALPVGGPGRSHYTGSQENIHLSNNYTPQNKHYGNNNRNDDYSSNNYTQPPLRPPHAYHASQQINYNERMDLEPPSHDNNTRQWNNKTESVQEDVQSTHSHGSHTSAPRVLSQETSSNSISSDTPSSNKLLESITSIKISAIDDKCMEILDWSEEMEKINNLECNINVSSPPQRPADGERGGEGRLGRGGQDQRRDGGPPGERRGGKGPRRRRRNNGGVRKRNAGNRSSSRGSQRREPSNDVVNRRSDRSPHSQGGRDHFRDSQEHHNSNHNNEGRGNQTYHRNEYIEGDRPPSRNNNWNRSQYSRENSRDRYSYSRTSSGERGGSRERPPSHLPASHHGAARPAPAQRVDPEGFRLPPPPPNAARNSRNQNRRDSWSQRGSRHGSVESGVGDVSPLRAPGLVGGPGMGPGVPGGSAAGAGVVGGRRRRRKDSERSVGGQAGATPAPTSNWRDEMQSDRRSETQEPRRRNDSGPPQAERHHEIVSVSSVGGGKGLAPGILVLPHDGAPERNRVMDTAMEHHHHRGNPPQTVSSTSPQQSNMVQRTLFNPLNPGKPIVVSQPNSGPHSLGSAPSPVAAPAPQSEPSGPPAPQQGGRPLYYDVNSDNFKFCHNQDLIREVERADLQLQWIFKNNTLVRDGEKITLIRQFLQHSLRTLLTTDIKFCQTENVEHHFWKMLYYSIIEVLRKTITQDEANKSQYTEMINATIKDGNTYFESLLETLQVTYKFKLEEYLNINYRTAPKGSGFVSLALISAQKIYLFLGDLARYKEQVNDTTNYAKSKNWYTKAHQINPKNGRPYNQLAILAVYARRKLDAVYFYMRSLMSSSPVHSARESLIALLDENRKKYESGERKRLAERQKALDLAGTAPATPTTVAGWRGGLRREVWTRAGRTTTLLQPEKPDVHSDEEELAGMTSVELNKRFITSYLHVHGKLITKIGMETFSTSAGVMLRQFRALLRHSPLPINCGRLLQLTALNMFAIDSAHLKDATHRLVGGGGCRSELQERALAVSLRMFGALLGRCCSLLSTPPASNQPLPVHEDVLVILPALKVWSDWMLYHSSVWNPPPPCDDFDVGGESDPWEKLAKLMNLLEPLDLQGHLLVEDPAEDHEMVRLPEDTQLSGFTPLMYGVPGRWCAPRALEPEAAHLAVRARALLFLGTQFLCGTDPPALASRLGATGVPEYVSVVQAQPAPGGRERVNSSGESDIMEASLSEGEEEEEGLPGICPVSPVVDWAACVEEEAGEDEATRRLLKRRGELEKRRQDLEKRRLKMQSLLKQGQVSVELEVRPRYLVPDTNCFIEHLPRIQKILNMDANCPYTIVVPLVVVAELEGLTRASRVGDMARAALALLKARRPVLRFATTRGNLLASPTFTAERDGDEQLNNDDRILAASLSLCQSKAGQPQEDGSSASTPSSTGVGTDGVRRLVREVVLLTDDRNLRVKALSRDLPVRDLAAFMRWAALD